jgi:hypothetical protein
MDNPFSNFYKAGQQQVPQVEQESKLDNMFGGQMPRTARMVIPDEQAVYHVMSRTALDGYPIGSVEKDYLLKM